MGALGILGQPHPCAIGPMGQTADNATKIEIKTNAQANVLSFKIIVKENKVKIKIKKCTSCKRVVLTNNPC